MNLKTLPPMQNSYQTSILKSILSDEEIPFYVKNENLSSVYGFLPEFEEEIQVNEDDYLRAIDLIKKGFPEIKIE